MITTKDVSFNEPQFTFLRKPTEYQFVVELRDEAAEKEKTPNRDISVFLHTFEEGTSEIRDNEGSDKCSTEVDEHGKALGQKINAPLRRSTRGRKDPKWCLINAIPATFTADES